MFATRLKIADKHCWVDNNRMRSEDIYDEVVYKTISYIQTYGRSQEKEHWGKIRVPTRSPLSWQYAVSLSGFPASGQFAAAELFLNSTTKPLRQRPDRTQLMLLLMAGDIYPNAGPTAKYPCPVCARDASNTSPKPRPIREWQQETLLMTHKEVGRSIINYAAPVWRIHAFISIRLDYCNSILYNLPKNSILRLQIIQNQAARILTKTPRRDHITEVLIDLHWLRIEERIVYNFNF